MGKARNWRMWLFVGLACIGGCAKQDAEKLSHIAQKSGEKFDRLSGGVRGKVNNGWHAARGSFGDASLDCRVEMRLKWDTYLVNSDIHVKTTGPGVIELTGTVANDAQRQRAVELANSTEGVSSVTDLLDGTRQ